MLALLVDEHTLGRCDAPTARQAVVQGDLGLLKLHSPSLVHTHTHDTNMHTYT